MERIRVPKIENVTCTKSGTSTNGVLHLTAHHLIFCADTEQGETWIPYPLIALVTRTAQSLTGQAPLTIHTRTFTTYVFIFQTDAEALSVFDNVRELTVVTSTNQLYAFFYTPSPSLDRSDGWDIYSPREEFGRMGVGTRSKAWRFTDLNKDYSLCSTYPAKLVVPTRISDTTLQYAAKYRSKGRVPALAYLHWANFGTITRCSQPLVGFSQNRSIQDEKLVEAIFQSHWAPDSRATASSPVFGATATNLIMDARPTTNAVANTAKGAGTENMDHYKEGRKAYLGIDNIHTMRDSLAKVVDALREADQLSTAMLRDVPGLPSVGVPTLDRQALRRSNWLRHISNILVGTLLLVKNVHVNSSHVLIHCSDGWDRTSQLSSLSQLCLDPHYRTIKGFQILVEKDWLSFGHRFLDRSGHLSSEKYFVTQTEREGAEVSSAQSFFASVQNRIVSPHHLKEVSPVFHQFLETVRQIQRQFPDRFEFNERFLQKLLFHLYSCQFGTFLFNCELERRVGENGQPPACDRTRSVWDTFNSSPEKELNLNPTYDPTLDDPKSTDMGVLFPSAKDARFWHELYGRTDEEMNGRPVTAQLKEDAELVGPIESAAEDKVLQAVAVPSPVPRSPSPPLPPLPDLTPNQSPMRLWNTSPSVTDLSSPGSNARAGDFFGGKGMKSVWGKFSSNATAAFSVVSEAYEGVTRDFKTMSTSAEGSQTKEQDNWSRTVSGGTPTAELTGWGESKQSNRPSTLSANPWATTSSSSIPISSWNTQDSNPWASVKSSTPTSPSSSKDLFGPLFADDPSIATPKPKPPPKPEAPIPPPANKDKDQTDPLGVGVL